MSKPAEDESKIAAMFQHAGRDLSDAIIRMRDAFEQMGRYLVQAYETKDREDDGQ